ncbi:MAG: hypothetical protein J4478_02145, partial [Candidatus Diapherotrites archaeon]|nr:hypothetical protein [Candidatus Diapherotrites archaeon]
IDVKTFTGRNYADVNWSAVSDNNTSQTGMLYRIFRSLDGISFSLRASQTGTVNYADLTANDSAVPNSPVLNAVSNPTSSSLDVSWNAAADNGILYYYKLETIDSLGNDANSAIDSNAVVSGVKQY